MLAFAFFCLPCACQRYEEAHQLRNRSIKCHRNCCYKITPPIEMVVLNLESLANELLLDVFEFFTAMDLLRAFHGLNTRLDTLLFKDFRAYRLDFRSVSKNDFDRVCEQQLPLIVDRIVSLRFADNWQAPGEIDLFLQHVPTLRPFTNLRSLSFVCRLDFETTMSKLLDACHHLSHLYLDYFPNNSDNALQMINHIWNLKLTHFHLHPSFCAGSFSVPTVTSTSLEHVCIENVTCECLGDLYQLFAHTPRLRHLWVHIYDESEEEEELRALPFPTLTKLKLIFAGSQMALTNLLKSVPNLSHLIIKTFLVKMNGHRWRKTIVNHLHNLKVFRFKMEFQCYNAENKHQMIDEFVELFRSHFWLNERRCFVRCSWSPEIDDDSIYLCSLPYTFDDFHFDPDILSTSTDTQDYAYACFPNIRDLSVVLPLSICNWSTFPKFRRLSILHVTMADPADDAALQLQMLLDRTPRLDWLTLYIRSNEEIDLAKMTYGLVRHLSIDFSPSSDSKMIRLLQSSLSIHCETLFVAVVSHQTIIELVSAMSSLRALIVKYDYSAAFTSQSAFLEWLKDHLPMTCTSGIDKCDTDHVLLWIR